MKKNKRLLLEIKKKRTEIPSRLPHNTEQSSWIQMDRKLKERLMERKSNPPQYSCLGKPMNRGAWRTIVHRVAKELAMT